MPEIPSKDCGARVECIRRSSTRTGLKRSLSLLLIFLVLALPRSLRTQSTATDPVYLDPKQPIERRVDDLLRSMKIKEKVGQLNLPCVYVDQLGKTIPEKMEACSTPGLPTHFSEGFTFTILGQPAPAPDRRPEAGYNQVSPSFFRTLKIPLKKGRYLDDHDTDAAPWVVVNQAFVRRYFPNEDPIGKQIRLRYDLYPTEEDRPRQIVGVVGDVKHYGLSREAPPFICARTCSSLASTLAARSWLTSGRISPSAWPRALKPGTWRKR